MDNKVYYRLGELEFHHRITRDELRYHVEFSTSTGAKDFIETFNPKTASGVDRQRPRSFLMLSDESLTAFAAVMDQAERLGKFPQHLRNTVL